MVSETSNRNKYGRGQIRRLTFAAAAAAAGGGGAGAGGEKGRGRRGETRAKVAIGRE